MRNLQLLLKTKWFEMTKAGIKKEDYREITPYWCNRLLLVNGKPEGEKMWDTILCYYGIQASFNLLGASFKGFDSNTMTLGYPKSTDTERILKLEHKGIEIRTGNLEWGAEPDKYYFVILHGSILS